MAIQIKIYIFQLLFTIFLIKHVSSDVEEETITQQPPPPPPYAFGYAAGRYPGHIDRTHSEISDGAGTIQGSFSYIDPRQQIRTVKYTADKDGFHPILNYNPPALPQDTVSVANAKQRHLQLYNEIAQNPNKVLAIPIDSVAVSKAKDKHFTLYQKIAEEHARLAEQLEIQRLTQEGTARPHY